MRPLLTIRDLEKRFEGTQALRGVSLELHEGEILALLGENGAGKSTLIKILAGVYHADAGSAVLREDAATASTEAFAFIHQESGLVPSLSVAENIALTAGYPAALGLIRWRAVAERARAILRELELEIDVTSNVASLSTAERALVAIARALARDMRVLVLDEPTATLGAHEASRLFATLRLLRERGVGVIYVTHRLDEVYAIADRVVVLRDGEVVLEGDVGDVGERELIHAITGRTVDALQRSEPTRGAAAEPLLTVEDAVTDGAGPFSMEVFAGEILGVCGLMGAGQYAVGRMLVGDGRLYAGQITWRDQELRRRSTGDLASLGISFTSGRRSEEAIAPGMTVRENLFPRPEIGRSRWHPIVPRSERKRAEEQMRRFSVRPPLPELQIENLSGGNQQKAMVARAIEGGAQLLVIEDPTNGVDVAARIEVYAAIRSAVRAGAAAVIVTTDFEEAAIACQRVVVFRDGVVAGTLEGEEATEHRVMELASASSSESSARVAR